MTITTQQREQASALLRKAGLQHAAVMARTASSLGIPAITLRRILENKRGAYPDEEDVQRVLDWHNSSVRK